VRGEHDPEELTDQFYFGMITCEEVYRLNEKMMIGFPRGLLFYRYETLWTTFFQELGCDILVSESTTQRTLERGAARAVDEACLPLKIYYGHVEELIGRCDYIFVPRISSFGRNRELCTRFASLYDMTENSFRGRGQRFLTCSVDAKAHSTEADAMLDVGRTLGFADKMVKAAYRTAQRENARKWKEKLQQQNRLWKEDGLKVLLAGHSYVIEDGYIGAWITDHLRRNGVIPIRADVVEREVALRQSEKLSPTCKWELNRELLGSVSLYQDRADGLILLSAFPCGADAMTNEILLRRCAETPTLHVVLDGQSGTAGLETRLESFLDIIRFKERMKT